MVPSPILLERLVPFPPPNVQYTHDTTIPSPSPPRTLAPWQQQHRPPPGSPAHQLQSPASPARASPSSIPIPIHVDAGLAPAAPSHGSSSSSTSAYNANGSSAAYSVSKTPHSPRAASHHGRGSLAFACAHPPPASQEDEVAYLYETFALTASRALRLLFAQPSIATTLSHLTYAMESNGWRNTNMTVWATREDWPGPGGPCIDENNAIWVVFPSHEEAAAALSLSVSLTDPSLPVFEPALETDLEPFHKLDCLSAQGPTPMPVLERLDRISNIGHAHAGPVPAALQPPADAFCTTPSSTASSGSPSSLSGPRTPTSPRCYDFGSTTNAFSDSKMQRDACLSSPPCTNAPFVISTNPPNPKTNFRAGDWLCPLPTCGAHNFGRNMACIGCGNARPVYGPHHHAHGPFSGPTIQIPQQQQQPPPPPHHVSPRFMSPVSPPSRHGGGPLPFSRNSSPSRGPTPQSPLGVGVGMGALKPPAPSYPLLTPSGHALSAGGRVRNISSDPLAPCIMYWPDNEPPPDRSQIRPQGSAVLQYPPIVNTGNKGAAEKQPGDWVCGKCNYLNWRRRKVCQTCYPYAEGNGDSISQAVQAERIALLTNVLNQVEPPLQLQRRASMPVQHTPAHHPNGYVSAPAPSPIRPSPAVHPNVVQPGYRGAARSRSQMDLRTHYHRQQHEVARPIYQTPVYSPRGVSPASMSRVPSPTSSLLPSCLQDVIRTAPIQSSPTTTSSSADLSFEEYELAFNLANEYEYRRGAGARAHNDASVAVNASIWKLDHDETRSLGLPKAVPVNDAVLELAGRMAGGLTLINA